MEKRAMVNNQKLLLMTTIVLVGFAAFLFYCSG